MRMRRFTNINAHAQKSAARVIAARLLTALRAQALWSCAHAMVLLHRRFVNSSRGTLTFPFMTSSRNALRKFCASIAFTTSRTRKRALLHTERAAQLLALAG